MRDMRELKAEWFYAFNVCNYLFKYSCFIHLVLPFVNLQKYFDTLSRTIYSTIK